MLTDLEKSWSTQAGGVGRAGRASLVRSNSARASANRGGPPTAATRKRCSSLRRDTFSRWRALIQYAQRPSLTLASPRTGRSGERSEEHTSELQSRPHLVC